MSVPDPSDRAAPPPLAVPPPVVVPPPGQPPLALVAAITAVVIAAVAVAIAVVSATSDDGGGLDPQAAPTTTRPTTTSTAPATSSSTTAPRPATGAELTAWVLTHGVPALHAIARPMEDMAGAAQAKDIVAMQEGCRALQAEVRRIRKGPPMPDADRDEAWQRGLHSLADAAEACASGDLERLPETVHRLEDAERALREALS